MSNVYIEDKKTINNQVVKLIDSKDDLDLYVPVFGEEPVYLVRRYSGEVLLIAQQEMIFRNSPFPTLNDRTTYKLSVTLPK